MIYRERHQANANMKHEIYTCDICGWKFRSISDVRNDISIINGDNSGCWGAVCNKCAGRVHKFVMELTKEPTGLPANEEIPQMQATVLAS